MTTVESTSTTQSTQGAHAAPTGGRPPMPMEQLFATVSRMQVTLDALAALGARLSAGDDIPPEIAAAIDDVLAAAGIPPLDDLAPPQRAMAAGGIRSFFGQAADLLQDPTREAGWRYTDPVVLEGQGRGSAMIPGLIAQLLGGPTVTSFLDVGTGVGHLAIGAAQLWPDASVVGLDVWGPSLERAHGNVAASPVADRIEIREQDVRTLTDTDRYDLAWVPSFFFTEETLAAALERVVPALRPGGRVVVGRYDPPPDAVAAATLRMRTTRDGGAQFDAAALEAHLRDAGCVDVGELPRQGPVPMTFVAGRKP